jgi:hypothetical protein
MWEHCHKAFSRKKRLDCHLISKHKNPQSGIRAHAVKLEPLVKIEEHIVNIDPFNLLDQEQSEASGSGNRSCILDSVDSQQDFKSVTDVPKNLQSIKKEPLDLDLHGQDTQDTSVTDVPKMKKPC